MSAHYPSFEVLEKKKDRELFSAKRSLRSILSNLILFFFLLVVVVVITSFFPEGITLPGIGTFSTRWLAVIPLLILLEVVRKYNDDIYMFQKHGLIHYEGRLSLQSSTPALKYGDILSIRVKQDLVGRILDYGNLELDSAGTTGVELVLNGIRSPAELAQLIERLRIKSIKEGTIEATP